MRKARQQRKLEIPINGSLRHGARSGWIAASLSWALVGLLIGAAAATSAQPGDDSAVAIDAVFGVEAIEPARDATGSAIVPETADLVQGQEVSKESVERLRSVEAERDRILETAVAEPALDTIPALPGAVPARFDAADVDPDRLQRESRPAAFR